MKKLSDDDQSGSDKPILSVQTQPSNDYREDPEFSNIFNFLKDGILTRDDKTDKLTLLLHDQYYIENNMLFRLALPLTKRNLDCVRGKCVCAFHYHLDLMCCKDITIVLVILELNECLSRCPKNFIGNHYFKTVMNFVRRVTCVCVPSVILVIAQSR